MKLLIFFLSFLFTVSTSQFVQVGDLELVLKSKIENIINRLPKDTFDTLYKELESLKDGVISANVSDYSDKIMANIAVYMTKHGLDPAQLPDENVTMPVGHINLTNGWLSDISTLSRNGDIEASYSTTTNKIILDLPIKFDDLQFTYDYHAVVTLVNVKGGIIGEVKNVKAHVVLSFDFNEYHAAMDKFNIRDTGSFHIKFTGNGLVDWIVNILSETLTTFLHPLIIEIVQIVIKDIMNTIVDTVNKVLDELLHRT